MKNSYLSPSIDIIEVEIEDVVLQSSIEDFTMGETLGTFDDFLEN